MRNNIFIKSFAFLSLSLLFSVQGMTQDEATEEKPVARPARPAFESGLLFDNATTTIQAQKTLEMVIQHRFGTMDNGISDLYGIWAPSNIRLGLNYSILNNLMVGIGTTKFNKMQDIQIKYNILQQTRSNSIPVTVSLYEVIGIDGSAESKFGKNYAFSNRLSYFSQIIISHRFNDMISLQIAPSFTHYNTTEHPVDHDRLAISVGGRIKVSPQSSVILLADFPLRIQSISEHTEAVNDETGIAKPNICIGWEISTSTHAFHVYVGSAQNILPQENMIFNKNDFFDGDILIGLNITRLWGF